MNILRKPYVIDGIIGNGKMLGTLGSNGELHRLWWPQIAFPQHIDEFLFGVYVEKRSTDISWLNDQSWTHHQYYLEDTNVLVTSSKSQEIPIAFEVTDFCLPNTDTLVRSVEITSHDPHYRKIQLFLCASFAIAESTRYTAVQFDKESDGLVYYRHKHAFAVGSERECSGFEAGKRRDTCTTRLSDSNWRPGNGHEVPTSNDVKLNGNESAMGINGALNWVFFLSPEETISIPIFVSAGDSFESAVAGLKSAKSKGGARLLDTTILYWHRWLESSRHLHTENEAIKRLFKRSILTIKLMCDKSGAIVAAPEFDEDYTRCGGYAYCWGRDAAFVTTAIDQSGYHGLVNRFYDWTLKSQSSDGSWAQRHFMDGTMAPQWGLQVDETGSIIWGMWKHVAILSAKEAINGNEFAKRVWPAVKRGADFLTIFIDPETKLPLASRDLWEERDGEHIYSAAAVYAGLKAAIQFAALLGHTEESVAWEVVADSMLEAITTIGWSEERGHFLRVVKMQVSEIAFQELQEKGVRVFTKVVDKGYVRHYACIDSIVDVSLLGLCYPFDAVKANDPKMKLTAEEIQKRLISPSVGGLKRYEDDHYAGGNPWILTTLWMALYDIKRGDLDQAKSLLKWVLDHQTNLGLLPEQVDKTTGRTAWVVPLTWSHAMYVLTVVALDDLKEI